MEKADVLRFSTEQHLTPGMSVASCRGLWTIDPPITEHDVMDDGPLCSICDDELGYCRQTGSRCLSTVPLSVDPGEWVDL